LRKKKTKPSSWIKQLTIFSIFLDLVMEVSGKEIPAEFNTISIGSAETIVLHSACYSDYWQRILSLFQYI
jgi:hypothetical protein